MTALLPDDSPRTLADRVRARRGLVVLLLRRGGARALALPQGRRTSPPPMAFEFASTNLVIELGIILAVLIGLAVHRSPSSSAASIMIVLLALLFRRPLTPEARRGGEGAGRPRPSPGGWRATPRWTCRVADGSLASRLTSHAGLHGDQPLLRDGLGVDLDGHRDRPADRGRAGRVGAGVASGRGSSWSTTRCWRRSGGPSSARSSRCSRSCARSGTCRWPRCSGTAGSASAA